MNGKITVFVGKKQGRSDFSSFHRQGYWGEESSRKLLSKLEYSGVVAVSHVSMDYSGKGRSCDVNKFNIII